MIERIPRRHEFAEIVPVSAANGDDVDELERPFLQQLPEGEALYPGRLRHRSARALLRGRDRAGAGAAADARRDAVLDGGRRRSVRGAERDSGILNIHCTIPSSGSRRSRSSSGGAAHDQGDRHGCAPGDAAVLGARGLPRPSRQGEVGMARRRTAARRSGIAAQTVTRLVNSATLTTPQLPMNTQLRTPKTPNARR